MVVKNCNDISLTLGSTLRRWCRPASPPSTWWTQSPEDRRSPSFPRTVFPTTRSPLRSVDRAPWSSCLARAFSTITTTTSPLSSPPWVSTWRLQGLISTQKLRSLSQVAQVLQARFRGEWKHGECVPVPQLGKRPNHWAYHHTKVILTSPRLLNNLLYFRLALTAAEFMAYQCEMHMLVSSASFSCLTQQSST